jgi:hypothetical protein
MSRRTFIINGPRDRAKVARWAAECSAGVTVEFRSARRNLDQNALMWSLLSEISRKVVWYGAKLSADDWKDVLTASLRKARVVPGIDPGTYVPLGMRTSEMTKAEFGELIELIYAFGSEQSVQFHEQGPRRDLETIHRGAQ